LNIEREIRLIQPDASVSLQIDDMACQWVVTNYERLGAFVHSAAGFSVMVIDEAHRLKEPTAECTKHAFDIAAQIPNRYLLTGTPVLNREAELHTLLRLSGHPIGHMQLREFCEQFAGSKEFRNALRERLADWMLRRRKDVLPQLKGKHRQPYAVEMNNAERLEYQSVLGGADTPLVRIGQLRRLLERAKVASIMDRLVQMGPDDKAIVFCEFKETVAVIEESCATSGIVTASLMGHHSGKRRQAAVDRFQEDADCRVFVGTTKAAGTGINLTAANYVLFCSLPWTPALQAQAEDRAYRNGQLRPVMVLIPLVESSIDQHLWQMLLSKQALASDLLEPEQAAEDAMRQLASVA
jgi:SNF2 family DNA or RNA helicase